MNPSTNIFNILLVAILFILYTVTLPISLILSPAIEFLSYPDNVNNVIDNSEVEKKILTEISETVINDTLDQIFPVDIDIFGLEIEHLLVTEDVISWVTKTRRELIDKIYSTLENGIPLSFKPQYKGSPNILIELIAQYLQTEYTDLPACSEIATGPTEIYDPVEQGCKPDIIYISETLFHNPDTEKTTLFPRMEIKETEAQTISQLFAVIRALPRILIIVNLTLAFLVILLSHSKRTAILLTGFYTMAVGIATSLFWKMSPSLILEHNPVIIETEGTIFAGFHDTLNSIFTKLIQETLIQIGENTLNTSIIVSLAGIFLFLTGILLFRKPQPVNTDSQL